MVGRHDQVSSTRSTFTLVPERKTSNSLGSPSSVPNTVTGFAGRISSPRLIGVRPQKRQKALPGSQYARSPAETVACPRSVPV